MRWKFPASGHRVSVSGEKRVTVFSPRPWCSIATDSREASVDIDFRYTPRYAEMETWMLISGMARSTTQDALACCDLRAIKVGGRKLIDVRHGLAWLGSLPAIERA